MIKIAFNMVSAEHGGGFKTYNDNILIPLLKNKRKNKYIIFLNKSEKISIENHKDIKIVSVSKFFSNSILRIFWMQTLLPFYLILYKVDVFFSPMNILPIFLKLTKIKKVLVIHSNLLWLFPKDLPGGRFKINLQRFFTNISVLISDRLIVDSNNAKKEISKIFKNISEKISVVYLGVNFNFFDKSNIKFENLEITKSPYFLTISSSVKYHCLIELIKAYEKTCMEHEEIPDYLILSKNLDKYYFSKIVKTINNSNFKNKIKLIENIDKNFIPELYKNSFAYIFSSYCEVFGLTNLEAMYCKTPVLTSSESSIPEICKNAALYFDPKNIEDIKVKIISIYKNKKLRNELILKGYDRSLIFSWDKTFEQTMKIIDNSYAS